MPNGEAEVCPQGTYAVEEAAATIGGREVRVIEAKYALSRGVIGQVMVAKHLLQETMNPASVVMAVVHAHDNPDLRKFCELQDVRVEEYSVGESEPPPSAPGAR